MDADIARWRQSQRAAVEPFHVMRIMESAAARRAAGLEVFDLSVGQPLTSAPPAVLRAAEVALRADRIGYTPALGIPELRTAVAAHYHRSYDVVVDPAQVAITTGSSGAFLLAFLGAFDVGDTVAIARPGYPAYRNLLTALGCSVLELSCGPERGFQPTLDQLNTLERPPAGLVLASPANPTGSMLDPGRFAELARWCDEHGTRLISDEIYHGITFTEPAMTARSFSDSAIAVGSFSKYFSMTGWRLGWMLLPPDLVDPIDRLAGNFALCPPTLSQLAAIACFDSYPELDANVERYRGNRALLLTRLTALGITDVAPADGAFYVYADISRWSRDSLAFSARMLAETGVAVASGVDFDPVVGGSYIRLCFAGDSLVIDQAMDQLQAWLPKQ